MANEPTLTNREAWSVLFPVSSSCILKPLSLGESADAGKENCHLSAWSNPDLLFIHVELFLMGAPLF